MLLSDKQMENLSIFWRLQWYLWLKVVVVHLLIRCALMRGLYFGPVVCYCLKCPCASFIVAYKWLISYGIYTNSTINLFIFHQMLPGLYMWKLSSFFTTHIIYFIRKIVSWREENCRKYLETFNHLF